MSPVLLGIGPAHVIGVTGIQPQDSGQLSGQSAGEIGRKIYTRGLLDVIHETMQRTYRATLLALYQLALLAGILLMPLALVTRRFGLRLPVDRAVLGLKHAYERASEGTTPPRVRVAQPLCCGVHPVYRPRAVRYWDGYSVSARTGKLLRAAPLGNSNAGRNILG